MAANGPYQAYYCEENVLRLIASWPADARAHSEVWLITNAARRALILNQRRGDPDHLGAIVWDYHVVAVREGQVFDYDSRGVWGQDVQSYIVQTLAPAMALEDPAFVPEVRVFAAQDYVDVFSSDRRHMRDKHGGFLHAPPPWAARMPRGHQLDALLDLSDVSLGGRVYDVAGLVARFGTEQPAHGESAPNNPIPD